MKHKEKGTFTEYHIHHCDDDEWSYCKHVFTNKRVAVSYKAKLNKSCPGHYLVAVEVNKGEW